MNEIVKRELPNIASYGGRDLDANIKRANAAANKLAYTHRIWDRSRSQWTLKHLTCSNAHPWTRMRQISAEMQSRRAALEEAKHSYMRNIVHHKQLMRSADTCSDDLDRELFLIEASEKEYSAKTILTLMEGAMKEMSALADMHDTLKKQLGIVTEAAFEEAQVKAHLSRVFTQAARDVRATGRISVGNQEYLEQIGVCVASAEEDVIAYVNAERIEKPKDTAMLHAWLDAMILKYEDVSKQQAAWLGFDADFDASLTYTPPAE
jgi:hypothetical protein